MERSWTPSEKAKSYDFINLNYGSNILRNFLSVESLIKAVSDVEKLKNLLLNKSQKMIFELYYLNNYTRINPKTEIKSTFDVKEFQSFWKVKPTDEISKFINLKLLELFNEDTLKCFSNTD